MSKYRTILLKMHSEANFSQCIPCGGRCCRGCGSSRGYFHTTRRFEEAKAKYGFDEITPEHRGLGFMGEYGCKIKPSERSATCLAYTCGDVMKNVSKAEERHIEALQTHAFKSREYYAV